MASIDPSMVSDPVDQKWVVEISEILNHQLEIDIETPSVSLFQVPETFATKKPEAYEPQQIGLGPLHHFRPKPYKKMEQKKLAVIRKVLQDYKIKDYKLTVLDKVRKLVPSVRSCYDMFLQGCEDESLTWVFAIDGIFLLDLFQSYNSLMEQEKEEYLLLLKTRAYECKRQADEYYSLLEEKKRKYKEMSKINNEDIEVKSGPRFDEDDFFPPLLRAKEIVVTLENQAEWERIIGLPHHRQELPKVGLKKRLVAQDILMVENQIPFMMLKEIESALHPSLGDSSSSTNKFSPSVFRMFCMVHSPLELCSEVQAPTSVDHLLHYMYYSIANNVPVEKPADDQIISGSHRIEKPDGPGYKEGHSHREGKSSVVQVYDFITKIPRKEIVETYEKTVSILENFSQSKILIPSASKLHGKAGFKFYSLGENQGIRNIGVHGKDIRLPRLTLNSDSEVILRNLVAYETITANSDSFPLAEYMGLMCALITNVDDFKLLKRQQIIKGDLGEDEVAKLFIGMSNSIPSVKTKGKSKLQEMIAEINKSYDSGLGMKIYLLLKKLAHLLLVVLKAVGGSVEASWKIVAFIISIVTVFLLTSQAYCNVYGCDKTTVTLLPYASS